jgi:hypothetical protein
MTTTTAGDFMTTREIHVAMRAAIAAGAKDDIILLAGCALGTAMRLESEVKAGVRAVIEVRDDEHVAHRERLNQLHDDVRVLRDERRHIAAALHVAPGVVDLADVARTQRHELAVAKRTLAALRERVEKEIEWINEVGGRAEEEGAKASRWAEMLDLMNMHPLVLDEAKG